MTRNINGQETKLSLGGIANWTASLTAEWLSSNWRLSLNGISSCFLDIGLAQYLEKFFLSFFRVTWRLRSRDHSTRHKPFPIGDHVEPSFNGFRDIQWRMWRNGWHDRKWPLNKMSRFFIHFGTNRFLTDFQTSYRLSIVTFALGCTV